MPNVIKMFEKSKKETFMNEVKTIYKDAKSKYMAAQMNGEDINFVTLNENDTKYCIILDNKGNPKKIAMSKNGYFIIKDTLSDINSIKEEDIHTGTMNMNDCNQSSFNSIEGTTSDGETIKAVPLSQKYGTILNVLDEGNTKVLHMNIYLKGNYGTPITNPGFNTVKYVISRGRVINGNPVVIDTVYAEIGSGNFSYTYTDNYSDIDYIYKIDVYIDDESIGTDSKQGNISCFVAGTKVKTENGFMNIEDIKVGDKVYSYDLDNNNIELKEVTKTIISSTLNTYRVTIGNNIVEMSPKHQVYIIDKGWVRAFNLAIGDRMLDIDGNEIEISNIDYIIHDSSINTYNLTVDGNSNYFVTDIQVLVHNASSPSQP